MLSTAAAAHEARALTPVATARRGASTPPTIAFSGVVMLVLLSPFEMTEPLLRLPGQSISSVETVLLLMFGAWAVSIVVARTLPAIDTPLTRPWLAFLVATAVAATVAPAHRSNALHMVGRLTLAFGVYLAVFNGVTSSYRARVLLLALSVSGCVAATLVLMDFFEVAPVVAFLDLFRSQTATIGAQVRASGPFQYPTIASMFLEVAFACALGPLLLAIDGGRRRAAVMAFCALALIAEGVTLTYTRSGGVTIVLTLLIAAGGRARFGGFDPAFRALALLAVVVAALFFASRPSEGMRLRLTTEGQNEWYRAEIRGPDHLDIGAGGRATLDVTVKNTGQVTWDSQAAQPFGFSYHWLLRGLGSHRQLGRHPRLVSVAGQARADRDVAGARRGAQAARPVSHRLGPVPGTPAVVLDGTRCETVRLACHGQRSAERAADASRRPPLDAQARRAAGPPRALGCSDPDGPCASVARRGARQFPAFIRRLLGVGARGPASPQQQHVSRSAGRRGTGGGPVPGVAGVASGTAGPVDDVVFR